MKLNIFAIFIAIMLLLSLSLFIWPLILESSFIGHASESYHERVFPSKLLVGHRFLKQTHKCFLCGILLVQWYYLNDDLLVGTYICTLLSCNISQIIPSCVWKLKRAWEFTTRNIYGFLRSYVKGCGSLRAWEFITRNLGFLRSYVKGFGVQTHFVFVFRV